MIETVRNPKTQQRKIRIQIPKLRNQKTRDPKMRNRAMPKNNQLSAKYHNAKQIIANLDCMPFEASIEKIMLLNKIWQNQKSLES